MVLIVGSSVLDMQCGHWIKTMVPPFNDGLSMQGEIGKTVEPIHMDGLTFLGLGEICSGVVDKLQDVCIFLNTEVMAEPK